MLGQIKFTHDELEVIHRALSRDNAPKYFLDLFKPTLNPDVSITASSAAIKALKNKRNPADYVYNLQQRIRTAKVLASTDIARLQILDTKIKKMMVW